jgi:hypothetical protein
MGLREEPRAIAAPGLKIDLSTAAPCAWPPKRAYAPVRAGRMAAIAGWMPVVVPAR